MPDKLNISPQDKPISIIREAESEFPFVILDVHGTKRARFAVQEDAQAFGDAVNFPEGELMQKDMHDTGVARGRKGREQSKGKKMPRGIPNKKTKKAKKSKKAAVVKKPVQKTMKRRKKRKA